MIDLADGDSPNTVDASNLVAWWPLCDDLEDDKNNYDMTAYGGGSFDSSDGPPMN
jgi:hypothetical protein